MRRSSEFTIQRDAHVNLVNQTSDRLCLRKTNTQTKDINQILTPNIFNRRSRFANASKRNNNRRKRKNFKIREPALFQITINASLPCIETCRESDKAIRTAKSQLVAQLGIIIQIHKSRQRRRKTRTRMEMYSPFKRP